MALTKFVDSWISRVMCVFMSRKDTDQIAIEI